MKLTSTITSAGGKYYENGAYHYHSDGCFEKRSDGKFFAHYYANMGNMSQEITETEYNEGVARIRAVDGKPTKHWSKAIMTVTEKTQETTTF